MLTFSQTRPTVVYGVATATGHVLRTDLSRLQCDL